MKGIKVCSLLEEDYAPYSALRLALRAAAREDAAKLARSEPGCQRITWRLYLIETLEACRTYAGEDFYRDVLVQVREILDTHERGEDA